MNAPLQGAGLAVLVAGLFAATAASATPTPAPAAEKPIVMCSGINACKGQSACATATSACRGQNACKGHGWVAVASEKECTDNAGTVIQPAPADKKTK